MAASRGHALFYCLENGAVLLLSAIKKATATELEGIMQQITDSVNVTTSPGLTGAAGCIHGFFERGGGVSLGPHRSLNVGLHVGDDREAVWANRVRIKNGLGLGRLISARQVHGIETCCITGQPRGDEEIPGYDALITDRPGVGLMVQHADCQPVLLFDPVRRVAGAVHSGWRGSVRNILGHVVNDFVDKFSSNPQDIKAAIGPSLGPCCAEFIHYRTELPEIFQQFAAAENHFDFWRISSHQLLEAGLLSGNIDCVNICTCCNQRYFSYRRAVRENGGITGRLCSVIALV